VLGKELFGLEKDFKKPLKINFKITIITINLNNLTGLEKTTNSIPFDNEIEWVVVDGLSTDGSLEFLADCARKPDKLISEKDSGIYDAMNKGIHLASGEYINFMNAGDYFEETFFENSLKKFNGTADIIYGNTLLSGGNFVKNPSNLDFFYIFNKMINHQSLFLKKGLLIKHPFDLNYKIVADWVQLFNILKFEQPQIQYLDKIVCVYDTTGYSSRFDDKRKSEKSLFLKTIYSDWELNDIRNYSKIRIRDWYHLVTRAIDSKILGSVFSLLTQIMQLVNVQFRK
jgi:glycosyltransferase involved in cell wall biosynthesis